jgi:ATP-binding cassette subfamily F protein 3
MLTVKQISKNYGSRTVLSGVSFALGKGDKAALVGPNGVGKTTLLRIFAGIEEPDSGTVEVQKTACIGYLEQDTSVMGTDTVLDYLKTVSGIIELEKKLEDLSTQLTDPKKALEYGEAQEKYDRLDGYSFSHRAQIILSGFGFVESDMGRSVSDLSSGQKVKVSLAGILLKGVDLLLLDEPTNNLDLPSLIWLEDFLKTSEAVVIVVSHDRRFLDKVTRKIIEIDRNTKSVTVTGGKYSDYLEMSIKRLESAREAYRLQQEEIERLTEEVRKKKMEADRGSRWQGSDNDKFLRGFKRDRAGRSGKRAKAIEKRIDQIEKVERPIERDPLEIPLEAPANVGTLHITLDKVVAGYPGVFSIGPVSIEIMYGNRVGIMGLNGSGKSTLLKTLTGVISPLSGSVEIGSGIRIGNMMQEHEILPKDKTPIEFLEGEGKLNTQDSYAKLAKFGIGEQQARRLISELSPGGRARLILAFFSALSVNALVLDEPTNHLDIEAVQALEETLALYKGTVILVSHDRYFLEKAKLNTVYLISAGQFSRIGDYKEYIESIEKRAKRLVKSL